MSEDSFLTKIKQQLAIITTKTGVPAPIFILSLIAVLAVVFAGYYEKELILIVGIVLPAYWSIKAIESPDKEDDKQWLTYWAVFGIFHLVDLFFGWFLKMIPFYFFLKLAFLIFCFMPSVNGAAIIYEYILIKVFKQYEKKLEEVGKHAGKFYDETKRAAGDLVVENKDKLIGGAFAAAGKLNEFTKKSD